MLMRAKLVGHGERRRSSKRRAAEGEGRRAILRPHGVAGRSEHASFTARRFQLTQLATRLALPAVHTGRQYTEVGGLVSYGASLTDAYRDADGTVLQA